MSRMFEDAQLGIGGVPGEPLRAVKAFGTYWTEFVGPMDDTATSMPAMDEIVS